MQILFDRTAVVFTIESIQHFSQFIAGDSYYLLYATISKEIFCIISNDQILHIKKIPRSPGYHQPTIKICPKSFDHCKNPLALLKLVLALFEISRNLPKLFIVTDVSTGAGAICYCCHCYTRVGAISKLHSSTPKSFTFVLKSTMNTKKWYLKLNNHPLIGFLVL